MMQRLFCKMLAQNNKPQEAARLLENALKNNPYDGNLHYVLARVYKEAGNIELYALHLQEAVKNPDNLPFDVKFVQKELDKLN